MYKESSPETHQQTIADLETVVNEAYLRVLADSPFAVTVRGHRPSQVPALGDIVALEISQAGLIGDEVVGIDTEFTFPSQDPYGDIRGYVVRWNNGVNWTYAQTETGPIGYAGHGDRIIGDVVRFGIDSVKPLVDAVGLPSDLLTAQAHSDIEEVIGTFARTSQQLHQRRESSLVLNPYSALKVVQDSALLSTEEAAEPHLIHELRLEVRHFNDVSSRYPAAQALNLPAVHPVRAQHIVFHRDETASFWRYYASYDGPIRPGEMLGEYEESVDQLISPPTRLATHINRALEQSRD